MSDIFKHLIQEVRENPSVLESVGIVLTKLAELLRERANTPREIQALAAELEGNRTGVAAAIQANTAAEVMEDRWESAPQALPEGGRVESTEEIRTDIARELTNGEIEPAWDDSVPRPEARPVTAYEGRQSATDTFNAMNDGRFAESLTPEKIERLHREDEPGLNGDVNGPGTDPDTV